MVQALHAVTKKLRTVAAAPTARGTEGRVTTTVFSLLRLKALVVQDGRRRRSITPEAKGDGHAVGPGVVEVGKELMTRGNAGREAHETPGKETTAELEIVQRKYSIVRVRNIATVVIIADREFVIVVRVSTREGVVPVTNNAEGTTAGAGHARGKG